MKKQDFIKRFGFFSSLAGIVFFSKILGFVNQMIKASTFGATAETDLISLSEGLIANTEYLISGTLISSFVTVYLHVKARGANDSRRLISDAIKMFLFISFIISFAMFCLSPLLARLIAPTYTQELSRKLSFYLRIFVPVLLPYTLQAVFSGVLNANRKFVAVQLVKINHNLVLIASIVLLNKYLGINSLVVGYICYSFLNAFILGTCSKKYWDIQKGNPFRNEDIKELLRLMLPLIFSLSMVFVNQLVDKVIVSGMEAGAVTALGYGSVISNLITTFVGTFGTVLFTKITSSYALNNNCAAARTVEEAFIVFVSVLIPIWLISFLCAEDIVTIVFGRGAFEKRAILNSANALRGYCFVFIPYAANRVFAGSQVGNKNTKNPAINSVISIFVNIIFSLILYKPFGIIGVSFASSLAEIVCAVLNYCSAKKHNEAISAHSIISFLPVWCFSSLICVSICVVGTKWMHFMSPLMRFLIISLFGILCYGVPVFAELKAEVKKGNFTSL